MPKQRRHGEGGLYFDKSKDRWIASVSLGFKPNGKRDVKRASGKTVTEAKEKLKQLLRDVDDGVPIAPESYTVKEAVENWLERGLVGRSAKTVEKLTGLAKKHVIADLGARKLRFLTADEVEKWLTAKAKTLSTRTLRDLRAILRRAIRRAMAHEKVKRNVVDLVECPEGQEGRPSKSLNHGQAEVLLSAAEADDSTIGDYIVVSLLTGGRTEEIRALTWPHTHVKGKPKANPPRPPHVDVWRSVRAKGETKTRRSRRSLALCKRASDALVRQQKRQQKEKKDTGKAWQGGDVVFASLVGTQLDAANVRRGFRRVLKAAGLNPWLWTPRELRHSFVSLLSDDGVPIEVIARLVGHSGTSVTETVYRHQIRPVLQDGAMRLDGIFPMVPVG